MVASGVTDSAGAAEPAEATTVDGAVAWAPGLIWRDIARGGLAGLVVGLVVAGVGGRLAMRFAALLVPTATGTITEADAVIGVISLGGTMAVVLIGLAVGAMAGVIWVVIRTWLPDSRLGRALAAAVVAIALGSFLLIRGTNVDFAILGNHPAVVVALVTLVGSVGFFVSLVDGWLDRRLPVATSVRSRAASVYAAISLVGVLLILPLVVVTFLGLSSDEAVVGRSPLRPVGIGLLILGIATLRWWWVRLHGAIQPPRSLLTFGRATLAITVVLGLAIELPEIRGALGIS